MYNIIINDCKSIIIPEAKGFTQKLLGLMGKSKFKGLIFVQDNSHKLFSSIHTSFMKKTIDVIYLDKKMNITEITTLKAWKLFIPKNNNTRYIIELPENSIKRNNINYNTKIKVVKIDD